MSNSRTSSGLSEKYNVQFPNASRDKLIEAAATCAFINSQTKLGVKKFLEAMSAALGDHADEYTVDIYEPAIDRALSYLMKETGQTSAETAKTTKAAMLNYLATGKTYLSTEQVEEYTQSFLDALETPTTARDIQYFEASKIKPEEYNF